MRGCNPQSKKGGGYLKIEKMIKKKMLDFARDDFSSYLSELLNITRQTASNKLKGETTFTITELTILVMKLGITKEELYEAITTCEDVSENESRGMCETTK